MKSYTITVNGNVYDVTVEENTTGAAAMPKAPIKTAPAAAPRAAASNAAVKSLNAAQGGIQVSSPMPGKILAVKANVGQAVKKGDVILILEAMKMENEVVAPEDGTIASINTAVGDSVELGDVLATLN